MKKAKEKKPKKTSKRDIAKLKAAHEERLRATQSLGSPFLHVDFASY